MVQIGLTSKKIGTGVVLAISYRKSREATRPAKQLHAAAVDWRFENRPRNPEATAEQRCASPRRLVFTFAFSHLKFKTDS